MSSFLDDPASLMRLTREALFFPESTNNLCGRGVPVCVRAGVIIGERALHFFLSTLVITSKLA